MDLIKFFVDFILHIDGHPGETIRQYGGLTYGILFFIIFIETGFVFTPFLPGDSLLFAAGAFASLGVLNVFFLWLLVFIAAVLGDTINFWIGHHLGQRIIHDPRIPLDEKHLQKTKKFFDRYGGKTIILARFVPFARTFAPFVAGVGAMDYKKFISYNIIGGLLWTLIGVFAGYFFGNFSFVKNNFSLVIIAVIFISILPIGFEIINKTNKTNKNNKTNKTD